MLAYTKETIWHKAEAHAWGMERFMETNVQTVRLHRPGSGVCVCSAQVPFGGPLLCLVLSGRFRKPFTGVAEKSMLTWCERSRSEDLSAVNTEDGGAYRRSLLSVGHLHPTRTNISQWRWKAVVRRNVSLLVSVQLHNGLFFFFKVVNYWATCRHWHMVFLWPWKWHWTPTTKVWSEPNRGLCEPFHPDQQWEAAQVQGCFSRFSFSFFFLLSFGAPLIPNNAISWHRQVCVICYSALATFWNVNLDQSYKIAPKRKKTNKRKGPTRRGLAGQSGLTGIPSSWSCTCNTSGHLGVSASTLQTPACTSTSSHKKKKEKQYSEVTQALSNRIEPHAVRHSH